MAYRRADAQEEAIACLDEALTALVNGDADGCIRSADLLLALSSRGNMRKLSLARPGMARCQRLRISA